MKIGDLRRPHTHTPLKHAPCIYLKLPDFDTTSVVNRKQLITSNKLLCSVVTFPIKFRGRLNRTLTVNSAQIYSELAWRQPGEVIIVMARSTSVSLSLVNLVHELCMHQNDPENILFDEILIIMLPLFYYLPKNYTFP